MMKQEIKCPHCKKIDIVRRGYFQTSKGKQQVYFCKSCKKKFKIRNSFYRMRNHEKKITLCLDLFYRGMSLRKIQEHLQAFYPHNASHMSVLRWVRKYSVVIGNYTDKLKLQIGEEIQVDEMEFKTKGKKTWFIDSIDPKTKFMVSSEFTKTREQVELKKVMQKAKIKTGNQIKIITTDGYLAYEKIVKGIGGYNNKLGKHNIRHNIVNASRGEGFNHPIERLHNNIRERTKIFRGFGSFESAKVIMKGYEVFHNFIRKHQAIKKYPYELAIPNLKLNSPNRWLDLIKLADKTI